MRSIREYKLPSILTAIFMIGEAMIECAIPFIIAKLINNIQAENLEMSAVTNTGLILVGMAVISLCLGGLGGVTSAKASAGFAKNLMYMNGKRVKYLSFSIKIIQEKR